MKVILVIQSIIILAGAIYIFTLQQQESVDDVVVPAELPPPPPPAPAPSADEAMAPENIPTTDIAGPNDAGMEWPVIEADLEVR